MATGRTFPTPGYRETKIVTDIEAGTQSHKSRDIVTEKDTRDRDKETK